MPEGHLLSCLRGSPDDQGIKHILISIYRFTQYHKNLICSLLDLFMQLADETAAATKSLAAVQITLYSVPLPDP